MPISFFKRPAQDRAKAADEHRRAAGRAVAGRDASPAIEGHPWREDRVREIGAEVLQRARDHKSGVFSREFWSDKLMDWSMKDRNFKVQFFRFVDAFPVLRHDPDAVYEHLTDYLGQPGVSLPPGMGAGMKAGSLAKSTFTKTISGQIEGMGRKFIAGEDAASALPQLEKLWRHGIAFSVDLLGEACVSDAEADAYLEKYLDLVDNLPETVDVWRPNERLEHDHLGPIPRTNVSIKISALSSRCHPIDTDGAIADLKTRVIPILKTAAKRGVFINFDMEQSALKDLTMRLFMECCEEVDFHAGLAMQAYLRSGDADAQRIIEWSKRTGRRVSVRLVKGAYWDYETIHAEQMGWPQPVWAVKSDTDACFERMAEAFIEATPRDTSTGGVTLALGSHNARSIAAALDGLERRDLPRSAIELQMLHGMADQLKHAAAEMDLRVREYVPVGEMIPGMAYLVRRLLENTSNESWLRAGFLHDADPDQLLASPHRRTAMPRTNGSPDAIEHTQLTSDRDDPMALYQPERHALSPADIHVGDGRPFLNEPTRDFSFEPVRATFAKAVEKAKVPDVANDGTPDDALKAIAQAHEAFTAWRDTDPYERARIISRAAEIMRERRDELSGVVIKENGKDWANADADVCEAIDFCAYYARQSVNLFNPTRIGRFIGELDESWYQPRGVAAVISPWNFPLAICCGMTVAALVTGNTVVLKPAEQTPGIAKLMVDILREAGLPRDVLHFIPGPGETTGAALVRDPRVALICFTGSKAVGLDIIQAAGMTAEEQASVKKVICEMGGKNAIIVDTSADLDEAVLGVRSSAFGFQGQKCSACSRCIVVDPEGPEGHLTKLFLERLTHSVNSLVIKDPVHSGSDVGPVIDREAADKIRGYIQRAKERGLAYSAPALPDHLADPDHPDNTANKPFVAPHVFTSVPEDDELAIDEVFGPVLAIIHAGSFSDALRIANSSRYKLTGGVFTRKPEHIIKAKREFRVGNLYINRPCTGALVARMPFGGFGLSGVGSKAGGHDYLLQFVEPRASCENTMRRGFAPEL
jgi:RHH-type transcriptional regulator, proline utilization regulon repressor / proline dehydrogenase / delta 1-pyrroline-5-carboxylate dehydrogenase